MVVVDSVFAPIENDLLALNRNLKNMIGARHPVLYAAAEHLFTAGGKRLRPAIVLLCAKASSENSEIFSSQRRLAEITEIIHTASLVHDDVLDECSTRRGIQTVHNVFSTKIAILAGDFLFAQSSWYLANLENLQVVKVISKVITDFAEGEVRQGFVRFDLQYSIEEYIAKSFYKTGSLIAAGCQGAAMLSTSDAQISNELYMYGRYMGLAFQIVDDILDIVGSTAYLGKPAGSDLLQGNLTAPVLFSLPETFQLAELIEKEFSDTDNLSYALNLLNKGSGIQQAKDLAAEYLQAAIECLNNLKDSSNKELLKKLTLTVLERIN
uniref:Prenyl transferase n=1 Tax=Bangiopsis subsimplex TaxID=139980 RepID=A0A1C9CCY4_9RHOD|nr:prenyl transferase [Bangiopsis subsimplex]AOM66239.1 prenyl transferase [Bangiopsis subsimplex]ARO90399.1 prenyl transferase [Bangiopsis subsimplex]